MRRLDRDSEAFKRFIEYEKIIDIDIGNGDFTWSNKRGREHQVASILDHFLVLEEMLLQGMDIEETILPSGVSDHWTIVLAVAMLGTLKPCPFKF